MIWNSNCKLLCSQWIKYEMHLQRCVCARLVANVGCHNYNGESVVYRGVRRRNVSGIKRCTWTVSPTQMNIARAIKWKVFYSANERDHRFVCAAIHIRTPQP